MILLFGSCGGSPRACYGLAGLSLRQQGYDNTLIADLCLDVLDSKRSYAYNERYGVLHTLIYSSKRRDADLYLVGSKYLESTAWSTH